MVTGINRLVGLAAAITLLAFASTLYAGSNCAALDSATAEAPEMRARTVARFMLRNLRSQMLPPVDGTYSARAFGPLPPFRTYGVQSSTTVTVESLTGAAKQVTVAVRWYDGAPHRTGVVKISDVLTPPDGQ
jgi:hypothetical protein